MLSKINNVMSENTRQRKLSQRSRYSRETLSSFSDIFRQQDVYLLISICFICLTVVFSTHKHPL